MNFHWTIDLFVILLKVLYLFTSFFLIVYGSNCYTYVYLFLKHRKKRHEDHEAFIKDFYERVKDVDLPRVTTQLPIYNEKYVALRLIDAVKEMDYPKEKHEIQVLDDSNDETVEIVGAHVAELAKQGFLIHHIRRDNRVDFKAGALQHGMAMAHGDYLAIFDSDFVPPAEFLRKTVPYLVERKQLGFVQTRWGHLNRHESLLTRAQAIGIDGHFVIEQTARQWGNLFLNFNGTAGIWRKTAIMTSGGWQGDTLTEDLDLSYRAQLAGWQTEYIHEVECRAEIPADMNAFKSQQYRWAKGSIQTSKKLMGALWRGPGSVYKKIQSTIHLTHYSIHPLVVLNALIALPMILFTEQLRWSWYYLILVGFLGLATFAPTFMYLVSQWGKGGAWMRRSMVIPYLAVVGIGIGVNNTHAVLSGLFGKKGTFVRTPKTGAMGGKQVQKPKKKDYHLRFGPVVWTELALGAYCFYSFVFFLQHSLVPQGSIFVAPFLFLYGAGFVTAFFLSIQHATEKPA